MLACGALEGEVTMGMEEEQLERALRASLLDQGREFTPFTYFKVHTSHGVMSEKGLFVAN